jgi:DNA-binding NarL/FixJ family response regulator
MLVSGPLVQADQCPVEILLVDSRRLVRAGIVRVLSDSGFLVVSSEASSCDEAIRLVHG